MDIILTKTKKISIFRRIPVKITRIALITIIIGGLLGFLFFLFVDLASDISSKAINPLFTTSYGMILGAFISIRRT